MAVIEIMEQLKSLSRITEPDERQFNLIVVDTDSGAMSPMSVEHLHSEAASIHLSASVPENVRDHFSTARNLLVYAWFYYPFNVTAQFMGYVSVEYALKEKFKPKKRTSLRLLVKRAVDEGLISDDGFSHICQSRLHQDSISKSNSYSKALIDILPDLRNKLGHGSHMLHPNGAASVRICAEFINQLFMRDR